MKWIFYFGWLSVGLIRGEEENLAASAIVLYNSTQAESRELAEWYAEQRGIAPSRLVGLECSAEEVISRLEFENTIRTPLMRQLGLKGWWKIGPGVGGLVAKEIKTPILVIMRGVPLKIAQEGEREVGVGAVKRMAVNEASVDSELAGLSLVGAPTVNGVPNPYFSQKARFAQYTGGRIFLTGRIDATTDEICRQMVTDAIAVEKTGLWGRCYLDFRMEKGAYEQGDNWLRSIFGTAWSLGVPVVADRHSTLFWQEYPMTDAAWYFGWYTGGAEGPFLAPNFRFRPGAVACHIYSFSANSLRGDAKNWVPTLLSKGAAVVAGNVWEPYLDGTIHLDLFYDRLARGFSVAEATWAATKNLSWMNVVVGDPLYRPCGNRLKVLQALPDRAEVTDVAKVVDGVGAPGRGGDESWKRLGFLATEAASKDDFHQKLAAYLREFPDPVMLEALAAWLTAESRWDGLSELLDFSAALYGPGADAVRCRLLQADLFRMLGKGLDMERVLQAAVNEYKDVPEVAGLVALLRTIQPAQPPVPEVVNP